MTGIEATRTVPAVIFIGGPTIDHLLRGGTSCQAFGGAAFISALAARRAGAAVGLVARVPPNIPDRVASVFGVGGIDRAGLQYADGMLPEFVISYDTNDRATYNQMTPGLEIELCAADIPEHWLGAECKWIHVAGIGASAAQQRTMVREIRTRAPNWSGILSAGTCRAMVEANPEDTRQLLSESDVFFLNREEFELLSPDGQDLDHEGVIVVTDGGNGVTVLGGPNHGQYRVPAVRMVDPTGAGDSFCGGYIGATLMQHPKPIDAAVEIATHTIGGFGADPLIDWVTEQVRMRAECLPSAIHRMAPSVQTHGKHSAFNFAHPPHLPVDHPLALRMFVVATMHQYGFWTGDVTAGWQKPMYATLEGKTYKGSDFIWAAFARAATQQPDLLDTDRMARDPKLFQEICTADDGDCPVPDLASHNQIHQAHGQAMTRQWVRGYDALLGAANATRTPIKTLLHHLGHLPGYMADPLCKKANLLAVILAARPERFLDALDPENIAPIVDYHMMRICLRTGLVRISDPDLSKRINERQWVDGIEEMAIRKSTARALTKLAAQTKCSIAAIDGLFFAVARNHCLETEEPHCYRCPLRTACVQQTARFQPVFRTTAY